MGRYFDVNKLKETNPHLKTLLSIGGAKAGSAPFREIIKTEDSMRTFTRNAIIYMRDRHFDGIDVDWEYPGEIGKKEEFTQLLQVCSLECDDKASLNGQLVFPSIFKWRFETNGMTAHSVKQFGQTITVRFFGLVWFDFCFTAHQHILGHFGRGQLT